MGKAMKEKGLIEKQKRGCNGHFCDGGCSSTIASSGDSPAPDCGGRGGGAASPPEGNLVGLSANVPCPMSSKSVSPSFLILPLLKIGSIGKQK